MRLNHSLRLSEIKYHAYCLQSTFPRITLLHSLNSYLRKGCIAPSTDDPRGPTQCGVQER